MSTKKQQKEKPHNERYLKIPNRILNLRQMSLIEKVLLAHIDSFGTKGCWQSNRTLAEMFMMSTSAVSRSVGKLKKAGLITIRAPKGYYRTIWAAGAVAQNDKGYSSKQANRVRQNCDSTCAKKQTTNNMTIKENNKDTTATPPPLPAGGQASALLADRKAEAMAKIESFKARFGRASRRAEPMSPQEFEQRRQKLKKALLQHDALAKSRSHSASPPG